MWLTRAEPARVAPTIGECLVHDPDRHFDFATARRLADVAVQRRLGLLPKRRVRLGAADRRDSAVGRTNITTSLPPPAGEMSAGAPVARVLRDVPAPRTVGVASPAASRPSTGRRVEPVPARSAWRTGLAIDGGVVPGQLVDGRNDVLRDGAAIRPRMNGCFCGRDEVDTLTHPPTTILDRNAPLRNTKQSLES